MQEERLRRTLTRREVLKMSGAGVAGASLLAGCGSTGVLPDLPGNTPSADRDTNVVLIIMDSLRKDHVGAYGNDMIQTPNLDALAEESLRFCRAGSRSPTTRSPSLRLRGARATRRCSSPITCSSTTPL